MTAENLRKVLTKAAALPAADQERVARNLDAYLDDLATLRGMIDEAGRSLDAGEGKEINIDAFLARLRADAG
jgi:hypothetical protein